MMTRYNNSLLGSNFSLNVSESMYSPFKPPTIDIQLIDHSSLTSGQKTPPPKHAKTPGHHDPSKTKTTETAQKKTALRKKKSRSPEVPSVPVIPVTRPSLLQCMFCSRIYLRNILLQNPAFWNTHFYASKDVLVPCC